MRNVILVTVAAVLGCGEVVPAGLTVEAGGGEDGGAAGRGGAGGAPGGSGGSMAGAGGASAGTTGVGDVGGGAGGAGGSPSCPIPHQIQCGLLCVDSWGDDANCGFCGHRCADGHCVDGTCSVTVRGTLGPGAACGLDAECAAPLYCVNHACARRTCVSGAQCPNGEGCFAWMSSTPCWNGAPDGCWCGPG